MAGRGSSRAPACLQAPCEHGTLTSFLPQGNTRVFPWGNALRGKVMIAARLRREGLMSKQQRDALMGILRQGGLPLGADVATLRTAFNELMARVPVAGDVDQKPATIGGVDAIDVTIRGADTTGTILYFHGGVYVIGTAVATVPLVSDLARRSRATVVTVDYRLAPEHPYPAAVDDALAVYKGLLAQGVDASQIALAGESAGGGLAVATLLALRDNDLPLPSSAVLMSPYVDLTLSGETIGERAAIDPILTPAGLRLRVPDYVGD